MYKSNSCEKIKIQKKTENSLGKNCIENKKNKEQMKK